MSIRKSLEYLTLVQGHTNLYRRLWKSRALETRISLKIQTKYKYIKIQFSDFPNAEALKQYEKLVGANINTPWDLVCDPGVFEERFLLLLDIISILFEET